MTFLSYFATAFLHLKLPKSIHPFRFHHCLLTFLSVLHFSLFFFYWLIETLPIIPLAAVAAQIHTFFQFLPGPRQDSMSRRIGCIVSAGERRGQNKEKK